MLSQWLFRRRIRHGNLVAAHATVPAQRENAPITCSVERVAVASFYKSAREGTATNESSTGTPLQDKTDGLLRWICKPQALLDCPARVSSSAPLDATLHCMQDSYVACQTHNTSLASCTPVHNGLRRSNQLAFPFVPSKSNGTINAGYLVLLNRWQVPGPAAHGLGYD